jgi:predicted transcriptional regulator
MTTPRTTSAQRLEMQKNAKADRLSDRFEVSETTIQRDLGALEKKGLLNRDPDGETYSFQSRLVQARREDAIAQLALNYIAEGLTILLDAGSTTLSLARALRSNFQTLRIITNSIPAALELSKTNYKILLTGGEVGDQDGKTLSCRPCIFRNLWHYRCPRIHHRRPDGGANQTSHDPVCRRDLRTGGFVQIRACLPAELRKPFGYLLDADGFRNALGIS